MSVRFRRPTLSVLALVLLAAACDSVTDPLPQITVQVQDVTLEAVGDARQLVATVSSSDRLPEWESLNPEIVTVTRAGMAVAAAPGTARVRARVGSEIAEANVTVMPPVEVQLLSLTLSTDPTGQPVTTAHLRNLGGRGYYKIEHWQMRASPEGEHRRVLGDFNDREASVGLDNPTTWVGFPHRPDWVVVYSREPNSTQYRITGCLRVDDGTPCPVP